MTTTPTPQVDSSHDEEMAVVATTTEKERQAGIREFRTMVTNLVCKGELDDEIGYSQAWYHSFGIGLSSNAYYFLIPIWCIIFILQLCLRKLIMSTS